MQATISIAVPDASMTPPSLVFSAQRPPSHRFSPAKNAIPNHETTTSGCRMMSNKTLLPAVLLE
jgi:hypothetical protein